MESSRLQPGGRNDVRIARSNRRPERGLLRRSASSPRRDGSVERGPGSAPMTGRRHAFGRATFVAPPTRHKPSVEHFYYQRLVNGRRQAPNARLVRRHRAPNALKSPASERFCARAENARRFTRRARSAPSDRAPRPRAPPRRGADKQRFLQAARGGVPTRRP
jgi:hypothetical protein